MERAIKRKIEIVVNHVHMDEEDGLDVKFWLNKTPSERLTELVRLRKNYYTFLNGSLPDKLKRWLVLGNYNV